MKRLFFLVALIGLVSLAVAQNVGIGTSEPYNKLQVQGNFLVTAPTSATSTPPTPSQTKTLPGLGTISFLNTDSIGRLYDPGGPAGNYSVDLDSKATIPSSSNTGIEVTIGGMDLNTGDSLIIKESATGVTLLAVGNGYSTTGKWVFNSSSLYINFKSNVDFNTGAGFALLFRRLYNNTLSLPDISGVTGNAFFFDTKKGALRSGEINNSARGRYSVALGFNNAAETDASTALGNGTTASGFNSTAMGDNTTASGAYSTAMGSNTLASGQTSIAMGNSTTASGSRSVAMGQSVTASGDFSTAMGHLTTASGTYAVATGKYTDATGYASTAIGDSSLASGPVSFASGFRTTASGNYSTAMGSYVNVSNFGSFALGDGSTTSVLNVIFPNSFEARFAAGYRFYTSSNYSTGCSLASGANAWSTSSDVRLKENFADVNGEAFLSKISNMQLVSWNYKKQDPARFRHYGPMAQEFYAAFGKDKFGDIGNDTTINSADFDGVNMIAIQALEKRTKKIQLLEEENAVLKQQQEGLNVAMKDLKRRLQQVEALLLNKQAIARQ